MYCSLEFQLALTLMQTAVCLPEFD